MPPSTSSARSGAPVDLPTERAALERARAAVERKLGSLATISGGGADALADEYIDAVVRGTIAKFQQELVVFGRIDDDQPWRVGLYGIDLEGEQLVIDWRAPFAGGFYRARFDEPMGLERRVTYVGSIADLFVEDFATGEVAGSSPLLGELSRSRGTEMRAAVATLQSEQDELVRLDPTAKLVLRGGPGTGKTVVGLHRAAWLVYNDTRLTAGRILVVGPSDKFLRFVSAVLPTLGEARIVQTTFDRLLGPSTAAGSDERWLPLLDRFVDSLCTPAEIKVGLKRIRLDEVTEAVARIRGRAIPYRDQRKAFVAMLANRHGLKPGEVSRAAVDVWPAVTSAQAVRRLRNRAVLEALGADADLVDAWLAVKADGALADEVRARFEGVPATYGHVIVDEAQDLTLLQLRAVQRRSTGLSLVGDDAQRSNPNGLGLRAAAELLGVPTAEMTTAYRMSAEIARWLNDHAADHGIDAVELVGIRPTGVAVGEPEPAPEVVAAAEADLRSRWENVAVITVEDTWSHKGVEYDAVVVDTQGMDPSEVYLAASRAAHELVVVG
ncbi:AAA family ATPase [Aquihabitans sp. G128]|uniref:AAA family ATPase n=1 Tax=Aquihabitans sp. G128 TaxID=2849779 RepID=UPI001C24B77D|nr:AAA family ATPase [Aquihabitans sp. G128]QXC60230.1 AAA family ATPase [Aquihabitans sp. G128]